MAEHKKSFVLYADMMHQFEHLEDHEAGKLIKIVFQYVNDLNPEINDRLLKIAFEPIRQQLKRDLREWEETRGERSDAGFVGNLKRWHNDIYKQLTTGKITLEEAKNQYDSRKVSHSDNSDTGAIANVANIAVNVNDNVTVNVNDNVSKYSFEHFWEMYDKKEDRKKCERKWKQIADKDKAKILEILPAYIAWKKDKTFRKNPLTFLNSEAWNDEIPTTSLKPIKTDIHKTSNYYDYKGYLSECARHGVEPIVSEYDFYKTA